MWPAGRSVTSGTAGKWIAYRCDVEYIEYCTVSTDNRGRRGASSELSFPFPPRTIAVLVTPAMSSSTAATAAVIIQAFRRGESLAGNDRGGSSDRVAAAAVSVAFGVEPRPRTSTSSVARGRWARSLARRRRSGSRSAGGTHVRSGSAATVRCSRSKRAPSKRSLWEAAVTGILVRRLFAQPCTAAVHSVSKFRVLGALSAAHCPVDGPGPVSGTGAGRAGQRPAAGGAGAAVVTADRESCAVAHSAAVAADSESGMGSTISRCVVGIGIRGSLSMPRPTAGQSCPLDDAVWDGPR